MSEAIYISHDNAFGFALTEDGTLLVDLAWIARVKLIIAGSVYDSDILGTSKIWWTDTKVVNGTTVNVLQFKLGAEPEVIGGDYCNCRMVIYDASNINGVVWFDDMEVIVK